MTKRAYSLFKRPDLIAKGEPFLEDVLARFQAQVDYTPNPCPEIKPLNTNQRCFRYLDCFRNGEAKAYNLGLLRKRHDLARFDHPASTANDNASVERKAMTALGSRPAPFTKAVYLSLSIGVTTFLTHCISHIPGRTQLGLCG